MRTSRSSTPTTIDAAATYENPTVPARGIEDRESGQAVFREGRVTGARPGRVLSRRG